MKLHLGVGKNYLHGWTNVDLFSSVGADLYCEVTRLPFESRSCELIYASHVLEHVHRHMIVATLQHWRDLLRPGGVLRLAVPNFTAICEWYKKTGDLPALTGLLYGGQNFLRNYHTVVFDKATLTESLTRAGLGDVRAWDWRTTEHAQFDDFSQAYLPHMDKENGMLMSLNLEATR